MDRWTVEIEYVFARCRPTQVLHPSRRSLPDRSSDFRSCRVVVAIVFVFGVQKIYRNAVRRISFFSGGIMLLILFAKVLTVRSNARFFIKPSLN